MGSYDARIDWGKNMRVRGKKGEGKNEADWILYVQLGWGILAIIERDCHSSLMLEES